MKKLGICMIATMFFVAACESDNSICSEDSQCLSFCQTYAQSDLLYACTPEGTCQCVDSDEMACDAKEEVDEGELTQCEKLCQSVKPGTKGVCKSSLCQCVTETSEEAGDEASKGE